MYDEGEIGLMRSDRCLIVSGTIVRKWGRRVDDRKQIVLPQNRGKFNVGPQNLRFHPVLGVLSLLKSDEMDYRFNSIDITEIKS